MNPGEFDTKIIILQKQKDSNSDSLDSHFKWVPICEKWAKQITYQGSNQNIGASESNCKKWVLEVRYDPNITDTCRVKWGNKQYEIEDVDGSLRRKTGRIRITIKTAVNN